MKVPGVLVTALIAALYAFLQSLASGVSVLESWWVPVAVAALGVLVKWLDVLGPVKPRLTINGTSRAIKTDSKLRRFFLG